MNCLQSRQETFDKWLHKNPAPAELAEAGFYYTGDPTEDDDTVTCFCCNKELSGWESGDDPLIEHLAHPKTKAGCAWALLMNEKKHPTIPPDHATLLKAREISFKNWPHEKERGWVGKAKKMAKAGFHFAPSAESTDAAECIYCKLSLDGWERTDDPLIEHEKRAKDLDCAFFTGLGQTGSAPSILSLTKNAFAAAKTIQELPQPSEHSVAEHDASQAGSSRIQSKKRAAGKRKLPISKAKKPLDLVEHTDEETVSSEPVPIILKSARKKRGSTDPEPLIGEDVYESANESLTPIKRPRLRQARGSSINPTSIYTEQSLSPPSIRSKRTSSNAQGRRARTPFDDVRPTLLNTTTVPPNYRRKIKEEPVEEEIVPSPGHGAQAQEPVIATKQTEKAASKSRKTTSKRASSVQGRRRTRSSAIRQDNPDVEDSEGSELRQPPTMVPNLLPDSIMEEDSEEAPGIAIQDETRSSAARNLMSKDLLGSVISLSGDHSSTSDANIATSGALPDREIMDAAYPENSAQNSSLSRRGSRRATKEESTLSVAQDDVDATRKPTTRKRASSRSNNSTGSARRTSSRRRGSDDARSSNIEDIIMLDHRAKPRPQRISKSSMRQNDSVLSEGTLEHDQATDLISSSVQNLPTLSEDVEPEADAGLTIIQIHSSQSSHKVAAEVEVLRQASPPPVEMSHSVGDLISSQPVDVEVAVSSSQASVVHETGQDMQPIKSTAPGQFLIEVKADAIEDLAESSWHQHFRELLSDVSKVDTQPLTQDSLAPEEVDMTLEDFLRQRTQQQQAHLASECERMIGRVIAAADSAKATMNACVQ